MVLEYNKTVLEHFKNPRNVGEIDAPDGIGEHLSDICGDHMCINIKGSDNRITDIKFLRLGCVASIANGSVLTDIVKDKMLEDALKIKRML